VVGSVDMPVGSSISGDLQGPAPCVVRMLGPLTISRNGAPVVLPASRKVRALFAYLAHSPHAVTRSHLCELLWDAPNDPRGELRWCLSKIRRLVNEPGTCRVRTEADTVTLDLAGCCVDTLQVIRTADLGIAAHSLEQLRRLADCFRGEFLEGLELDRSPNFNTWLVSQRRQFRSLQAQVLECLVERLTDDEALGYLNLWASLSPLDERVHVRLLQVLARQQRFQEGRDHLEAITRLFEAESLDCAVLRHVWRSARTQPLRSVSAQPIIVSEAAPAVVAQSSPAASHRGSIAVMPFADRSSSPGFRGGMADALVHDIITRLAKLRSLLVIAQGTTFALHDQNIPPDSAGRMLNVEYVVGGSLNRIGSRLTVHVELSEVQSRRIVWAEVFNHSVDDAFMVLDAIGDRIVAAIAGAIAPFSNRRIH
jgi:DNA-binding SARP family transcriptional activator